MTSPRDALAALIESWTFDDTRHTADAVDLADAILAAGWRAPRPTANPICPDGDCVRDAGHDGLHYNIAGQPL